MQERHKRQKKRDSQASVHERTLEADETNDTIELDYGDDEISKENQDADTTAAIESQLLQDVATAAKADLPPLPENIESLPQLTPGDIKAGAVVVFKLFELSPKTMEPVVSDFKTAIVEEEGDSGQRSGRHRSEACRSRSRPQGEEVRQAWQSCVRPRGQVKIAR